MAMLDENLTSLQLQRVIGVAEVAIGPAGVTELRQVGSAKAMMPRVHVGPAEVVFLNTAGGVTGGDRLSYRFAVSGTTAMATTQTAERAYRRGQEGVAQVDITLEVGAGAKGLWLPQETILYDGAALHRTTRANLAGDAELCLCDSFVFGRVAMGEAVQRLDLKDKRDVWRDGRPVLIDPLWMGDADLCRAGMAGLGPARAVAVVHLIASDAADRLARLRGVLPGDGSAAASAWDGRLSLRVLHENPSELRKTLSRTIPELTGHPLPRVWPH